MSTPTVMEWIERLAAAYAAKPEPAGRAVVIEVDEMGHFLSSTLHIRIWRLLCVWQLNQGKAEFLGKRSFWESGVFRCQRDHATSKKWFGNHRLTYSDAEPVRPLGPFFRS